MTSRRGLSIMVWSCGPDQAEQAATPFVVAQAAAVSGMAVEMLFSARSVHWLLAAEGDTPIGFGPQRRPVSGGFRISAYAARVYGFDITECDIKHRPRRAPETTMGVHGARHRHAVQRAAIPKGRACEYRDHACICPTPATTGDAGRISGTTDAAG